MQINLTMTTMKTAGFPNYLVNPIPPFPHCRIISHGFKMDSVVHSERSPTFHKGIDNCESAKEQRLRVFENKVLRKIFGAKRDEVTGEWRKLHNAELHALYSSPDIIRNIKSGRLKWAEHIARMDESRNAYRVLVGRPEKKRPLGRPRRRWEDNIKMDLREVGYDDKNGLILLRIVTDGGLISIKDGKNKMEGYVMCSKEQQVDVPWNIRSFRLCIAIHYITRGDTHFTPLPTIVVCGLHFYYVTISWCLENTALSDVRFELTTSVPHESRSHRLHGTLSDVARWREERGCITSRDEFARASGAGREERALDFSGMPSLETGRTFEATSL
ncbi:hypothetical protein ANN_19886 [Periplaneta americana]|uniref:Uncharacterized protein n=1 Tax=Periplaneta americana TaxID=6978 RepID=A0ABQ8SB40_PERAM|nr:hypothetical protein ANN_19886 [Periplaneta americana]